jgi:hypothetical protein
MDGHTSPRGKEDCPYSGRLSALEGEDEGRKRTSRIKTCTCRGNGFESAYRFWDTQGSENRDSAFYGQVRGQILRDVESAKAICRGFSGTFCY